MQKKQFFLVVVSLALLTAVFFVGQNNSGYNLIDRMFGPDYMMGSPQYEGTPTTSMMGTKLAVDSVGIGGGIGSGMMPEPLIYPYYGDDALNVETRLYEKSSYHSVVVKDVSNYIRGLKEYFLSIGGVVLNSTVNSSDRYESASLYVKVPIDKFDEATGRVTEDVKKIVDEAVNAADITGQVVGTQETVNALEDQKKLLEAQLKEAKTELEKTRIQIQIDRVEKQIVVAQKAQESVETRTQYASIAVTTASNEKYFNPGTTGDFEYELQRAWESLKSFLKILGVFGIWAVVYSIVWAPIVWLVSKVVARFKK